MLQDPKYRRKFLLILYTRLAYERLVKSGCKLPKPELKKLAIKIGRAELLEELLQERKNRGHSDSRK